jgi:nucleoside diphosphate kinase
MWRVGALDALEGMSLLGEKIDRYGAEVFFRESWLDLDAVVGEEAVELVRTHALVLFKPDGIAARAAMPALHHLAADGFTPVAAHAVTLTQHITRALWLYRFSVASMDRVVLHDLIHAAGPSLLVALRDERAAEGDPIPATVRLTDRKGSSRPERRRPDQLRSRLAIEDRLLNYLHTSDEPADLVRELAILMTAPERREFVSEMSAGADWPLCLARGLERAEAVNPARRFDLVESRERLAALAMERGWWDGADADAVLGGDRDAGLRLWHLLLEYEDEVDRWDLIVLGSAVIDHDEAGRREQTIGDAPLPLWRAAVDVEGAFDH